MLFLEVSGDIFPGHSQIHKNALALILWLVEAQHKKKNLKNLDHWTWLKTISSAS